MHGERNNFDKIRVFPRRRFNRKRQRLALLKEYLRKVLHGAGNHKVRFGQIEALRHRTGKFSASATTISPAVFGRQNATW